MDLRLFLPLVFVLFFFSDCVVGLIHKTTAVKYWLAKGRVGMYHTIPCTNIPIAIFCWVKFGNPVATWKLLEDEAH